MSLLRLQLSFRLFLLHAHSSPGPRFYPFLSARNDISIAIDLPVFRNGNLTEKSGLTTRIHPLKTLTPRTCPSATDRENEIHKATYREGHSKASPPTSTAPQVPIRNRYFCFECMELVFSMPLQLLYPSDVEPSGVETVEANTSEMATLYSLKRKGTFFHNSGFKQML